MNTRLTLALLCLLPGFNASPLCAADGSMSFDGTGDFVEVPNFQNVGVTAEVTVEFWALANALGSQSAFMLFPDENANRFQAHISYVDGTTYWDCGNIRNAAPGRLAVANPPDTVGNWTHYALVSSQSGGFMKIYVNGVEIATKSAPVSLFDVNGNGGAGYSLRIGGKLTYFFDGRLDDFRVWNIARTQPQIQANLGAALTGSESGLRLYFKFDDGSGPTAENSATATGSAFNGTLNGDASWSTAAALSTDAVTNANDSGPGSLRQRIADTSPGGVIHFAQNLSGATITLTSGELLVDKNLTIDASALSGGITISGNNASRILQIAEGTEATLTGLTLTAGNGAAIIADGAGGAIFNAGTLHIANCVITGNSNTNTSVGSNGGGGIRNAGSLTLTDSAISFNNCSTNGGGISNIGTVTATRCAFVSNTATVNGGGIANNTNGSAAFTSCTFSGNSQTGGTQGGGGINNSTGTVGMSLTHCTVSGNSSAGSEGGGGIRNRGNSLTITNSIIAGNSLAAGSFGTGADVNTTTAVTATGANIFPTVATGGGSITGGTIITNAPLLAPLGNYGGTTQTMALLPGSPARNAATGSAMTFDQRNFPKVGTPDIGAYEAGTFGNFNAWIYETLTAAATALQHGSGFDYDGDGISNFNEWAALTDPASAASAFRITSAIKSGGNVTITFPSVTGKTYTLWQSDTLGGTWTNTNQTAVTGDGSLKSFTVPAPVVGVSKRFHRVQVDP